MQLLEVGQVLDSGYKKMWTKFTGAFVLLLENSNECPRGINLDETIGNSCNVLCIYRIPIFRLFQYLGHLHFCKISKILVIVVLL